MNRLTKPLRSSPPRGWGGDVLLAVGVGLLLAGCGDQTEPTRVPPAVAEPVALRAEGVEPRKVRTAYRVPGQVVADDRVQIASRISGFIQEVTVREGDRIAAGDLLVAIDPADVNGEIRRREAGLESAGAVLADARRDVTQFTTLLDQGGIPADTLRKAQVRLSVAEAALAQAEAALHTALAQRRYTRIESPVDGVVVARERQPGDLATPGLPILVLESRQSLVFQTFVAERHIGSIAPGDAVTVQLDAVGRSVAGQVLRIVPSGDPATRRYEVKVSLPVDAALLPGMFGRADFTLGSREALLVPMAAFTERLGLDGVFVVEEPGVARFRWIRWRDAQTGFREVTAGLEPAERVILDPPEDLTDGAPVITDGSVHGAAPGLERGE